ncbi:MAG: transcription termination/antitermination protein NusA [Bacteroides sp.]|nr:transcription termination/antitermination protein NusA [Bacteroidales bacterium]MBD5188090.1 transcription termination/antitermination protein NusA [Bacteroidales bacterium]MBD5326548.1 transcription termination/antitermination protein NusA [Bacteroides sp.]MBD5415813.1 transcription termination/antitermination protein NusA [Bacteroides sp.]MDE6223512.1 transcription termination factor NusA [Muribaculaceae bacterium]
MAKKAENTNMVERFDEFKEYKHIDKATMVSVLEESFRKVLSSMFGTDENLDVIMNPDKGDVQIFQNLEVVPDGEVQNPYLQISLTDARADNDPDAEIGEEHTKEIIFADFGRRAILNLRQTLQSKILDLQKEAIYSKFKDLEGELISAEVYQTWSRETLLMDEDHNELLLPKSESIPGDYFRKGETVRAVIANVENKNNNPKIMVSRVSDQFLRALFELEVPEIHDGLINIRAVARIPGERAKIAVESYDDRIDPVGACVGVKGSRIHGIVRELRNENIDVINWTSNPSLLIQRALSPAKISSIRIDEETKNAEVFLRPEEVSLAIGKGGMNIKLASRLTGYEIDVYRETENEDNDDIYLDEFKDEIDEWVIESLKNMGLMTAKAVLETNRDILIEKADLEAETVDFVLGVLRSEFDDEATAAQAEASEPKAEEPEAEAPAAE